MMKEDLSDLFAFAAIAEEGSFTRAAARLRVTTSALSHRVRALEGRLGTKLLNRTTRSVAATEAGKRLLSRLTPALSEISAGLAALADESEQVSGLVRLNAHRMGALLHVVPKLKKLRERHPGIMLDLTIDDSSVDIVTAGYDAGIRFGEHLARDMVAVRISGDYHSVLVASPDYLKDRPIITSPSDLKNHDCIGYIFTDTKAHLKWTLRSGSSEISFVPDPILTTNDMDTCIGAAVNGMGVTYLLREHVSGLLQSGDLVEVLPEWSAAREACYLYYPNRRQIRPALRAVIEALRERASMMARISR